MCRLTLLIATCLTLLSSTHTLAATFTECIKNTCAIITVPDQVEPGNDFDVVVEGYVEGGSGFTVSAHMLFAGSAWEYDQAGMVTTSAPLLAVNGFNWGGSFTKTHTFNQEDGPSTLTFVFGPRDSQHGYYDVAVQADLTALMATAVQTLEVPFDLKPRSCPNPINSRRRGVFSAAILGTETLDVTQIDPTSIKVMGISPIHYAYEDITEPYAPYLGKTEARECTTAGSDGHLDLTLKFKTAELNTALQGQLFENRQTLPISMTAELIDGDSVIPLIGEDVILVRNKFAKKHNKR